ncbi:hypothetical protein Thert_02375 [Thermoanaerobacterium thermosaccharolyticum]|jgi:hypothetical protein|uniref:Uncharacterized protein n=1 Tax=Thermoanaerobacterium thermosaccharolyticum TaxID=1517 RepID=A0A223I0N7_THETR|nr:hypothetical protein Thert_02375 [Thermoanaerobacterium thermosaccharolyticum]
MVKNMFKENKDHLQQKMSIDKLWMGKRVFERLSNGWAPLYYDMYFVKLMRNFLHHFIHKIQEGPTFLSIYFCP